MALMAPLRPLVDGLKGLIWNFQTVSGSGVLGSTHSPGPLV